MKTARCLSLFVAALGGLTTAGAQSPGFQFFGSAPPPTASGILEGPVPSAPPTSAPAPGPVEVESLGMDAEAPDSMLEGGGSGLGFGLFARKPWTMTLSVRQGYNSNVNASSEDPVASWYTNYALGLNYSFGTPRLQLSANLGAGFTYNYNQDTDNQSRWNGSLGISATYLATDQLVLTFSTSTAFIPSADIALLGGSTDQNNGNYFYTNTSFAATYQWTEKFSTTTSYNISATLYLEEDQSNVNNYFNQTLGQSLNYLIWPKTVGILEYRISPYRYTGENIRSVDQFFLVGVSHTFNPRLSWNARVGVQVNLNDNPVDGQSIYVGPYLESTLSYQFGQSSSIGWVMRYGTEASGIEDVTQRQTFRTGFTITHGFSPRLSATLGAYWLVNYYDQADVIDSFYENIFSVNFGVNYALNRFVSLSAGYQYTVDAAPEWTGRDYTQSVVFAGVNFTF